MIFRKFRAFDVETWIEFTTLVFECFCETGGDHFQFVEPTERFHKGAENVPPLNKRFLPLLFLFQTQSFVSLTLKLFNLLINLGDIHG